MKKILFILSLLIITILVLLPKILSSPFGTKLVIAYLEKKTDKKISIERLDLHWMGPQNISYIVITSPDYSLSIKRLTTPSSLWNFLVKNMENIHAEASIEGGTLSLSSPKLGVFDFFGSITARGDEYVAHIEGKAIQEQQQGTFSLQAQLHNDHYSFDLIAKNFPTSFLDPLYPTAPPSNILGIVADITCSGTLQKNEGPIELSIQAERASLQLSLQKNNHLITLRAPLKASLMITPSLLQTLRSSIPGFSSLDILSKTPIHLWIDKEGFLLPWDHKKNITIKKGIIDFGQMTTSSQIALLSLFHVLKFSIHSSLDRTEMWFSPLEFQMQQENISIGRVDILVDRSLHICSWGNIDWKNDKIQMTLGINADTLQHAFGITMLSNDYVMKVPITGKIGKIKIDSTTAAAKIAALKASSSQKGIAGILGLFVQKLDNQDDVPSPKRPFPWEN
ncbi:MAG: hypothetical protein JW769_04780 [Parachlamydiales bacterium]|nr:hypothetical protein [Parachlamydiales bacterium]